MYLFFSIYFKKESLIFLFLSLFFLSLITVYLFSRRRVGKNQTILFSVVIVLFPLSSMILDLLLNTASPRSSTSLEPPKKTILYYSTLDQQETLLSNPKARGGILVFSSIRNFSFDITLIIQTKPSLPSKAWKCLETLPKAYLLYRNASYIGPTYFPLHSTDFNYGISKVLLLSTLWKT